MYDLDVDEEDWEDGDFVKFVADKFPSWHLVRLNNFTARTFPVVEAWLKEGNVRFGQYEPIGWTSGCAYSVGVVFEDRRDAMIFKLRWI
jgi:hypothetical protein